MQALDTRESQVEFLGDGPRHQARTVRPIRFCDGTEVIGLLTERCLISLREESPAGADDVIYCFEEQDAQMAAEILRRRSCCWLAVLDHDKRLIGRLSLVELAAENNRPMSVGRLLTTR